jgi:hypothetical protein
MTAAAASYPNCQCGHGHAEHQTLAPQCAHQHCTCLNYRATRSATPVAPLHPVQPRAAAAAVAAGADATIDAVLAAGKRSPFKRTVALSDKIARELDDLRGRLGDQRQAVEQRRRADAARAKALTEIAELEKQLAAAKAKLKQTRHEAGLPGGERSTGQRQCPDCDQSFETSQRLGVHRRWNHGYRRNHDRR